MDMELNEPVSGRPAVHHSFRTVLAFSGLITFSVVVRLSTRVARRSPLCMEDGLSYLATLAYHGMAAGFFYLLYFCGMGNHLYELQPQQLARFIQTVLGVQILYALAIGTSKMSLMWTLRRLFVVQPFRGLHLCMIFLQSGWMSMTGLMSLMMCTPIRKNWDPTVEGRCGDQVAAYKAIIAVSLVIDAAMLILPVPVILTMLLKKPLRVKKPYKAALFAMPAVGAVSTIFAVARLQAFQDLDLSDFSYTIPKAMTWIYAETGIVMLVAGIATLRSAYDKDTQGSVATVGVPCAKTPSKVDPKVTAPDVKKGGVAVGGEA